MKATFQARNNAVFDIRYHLVLVTKYRRQALSSEMREHLRMILAEILEKWRCELIECGGESDPIHLWFLAHPALDLSKLVNHLKTVSSRLRRGAFAKQLSRFYWKPVF
jgi:putative transposase